MAEASDYYDVLGVPSGADQDQIRKAFRERVRGCHPDRVANLDEDLRKLAEEKMVELNAAYAVLRNPARRAAYDDRHSAPTAGQQPPATGPTPTAADSTPAPAPPSTTGPAGTRNRIGEQRFVARAACEEFEQALRRSVPGSANWTPIAFRGATLALRGERGRQHLYFVLMAAPKLDDKQLRRFLQSLESFAGRLKSRLWGRNRVFGFAAAVEFVEQDRQRRLLDQFNSRRGAGETLCPATLVDLVNWHVVPGETGILDRLESLLKAK